ncbi:CLUMA_CG014369, isoform A [Clunio marinus]|uniref:Protein Smaug n=1 Tax=Clunio marinus TaxID=568069 RepID=A0A1J1INJ4_9DIPT|nr:CLUMA_CG014369, isoform A [Clunio marinus]
MKPSMATAPPCDTATLSHTYNQFAAMYSQWNDCEKTLVINTVFKLLPFANIKLLSNSIDHHLENHFNKPHRVSHLEDAANATTFLNKLFQKYKTLTVTETSDKNDKNCEKEDKTKEEKNLEDNLVAKYSNKEEIASDLLMYLPLLRSNNDECKKAYMQFVPLILEDTTKSVLPAILIQQYLTYLMIHPMIKNDDQLLLKQWQRKLEEYFATAYIENFTNSSFNFTIDSNSSLAPSSCSSLLTSSSTSSSWLPLTPDSDWHLSKTQDLWDSRVFTLPNSFDTDKTQSGYPTPIGNKNPLQTNFNSIGKPFSSTSNSEHNASFSQNGKEVTDEIVIEGLSNQEEKKERTTSRFDKIFKLEEKKDDKPAHFSDHVINLYGSYGDENVNNLTKSTNSLTTSISGDSGISMLSDNAPEFTKIKKVSDTTRSSESSTSSRIDELNKMSNLQYASPSNHIGMGHICVWLKSLRLHKYFWLFNDMTYEQMMEITEEFLEGLGVTKGARHKLFLCIQKLADRVPVLKQLVQDLIDDGKPLKTVLDELTNIILTPMKPINTVPYDEDVASHVMRLLDCAFQLLMNVKFIQNCDEECFSAFNWLVDKALYHDSFAQQITRLKEFKYKIQRLKIQYGHNKFNFSSGSKGNKLKWNTSKQLKTSAQSSESQVKYCRKNMMQYYGFPSLNQSNKSYGNNLSVNLSNFQKSASREKLNQFSLIQQQHHLQFNNQQTFSQITQLNPQYYRHSMNNPMGFNINQQQVRNSSCSDQQNLLSTTFISSSDLSSHEKTQDSGLSMSFNSTAASVNDVNNRLESLCLQMADQAIE